MSGMTREDRLALFLKSLARRNIRTSRAEAARWFHSISVVDWTDPEALDAAIDALLAARPAR
jgi:hypothetical protein